MARKTLISKLFSKLSSTDHKHEPQKDAGSVSLNLLFFIVDWCDANIICEIFDEAHANFHFHCKGMGTANSEILDVLGIGASVKAVFLCLEQSALVSVLMKAAQKKIGLHKPGAGIAFTIPLSAINDPLLLVFKRSIHENEKTPSKGGNMDCEFSHDLILTVVNQGYSDEIMNTARKAGVSGGTIINARGQAHEGVVKFFGISVQEERELILMLTKRENKVSIMRALSEDYGLNSKANGLIFSLPVDNVMGLNLE